MDDLKLIKKHYGENMMHLCRELFPTLLEKEGLLFSLISQTYSYSRLLYDDIKKLNNIEIFKRTIYSLLDKESKKEVITNKTPQELLSEAGYDLYECETEEDIQSFKKYYAKGEELCTFRGNRLNRCYVFWAVKKDVDKINRKDFTKPERQDRYGTSVISIQFSKDELNTLSIKNRYNHTVNYPDSTFSNDLDNIIPGLKNSFEKHYNLNLSTLSGNDLMSGYVQANDGKFYKYNYEINNIYYCPNNIIIDNFEVKKYDKSKYIVLDYFIIDLVNKTIKLYDNSIDDSFLDGLQNINNIKVEKDKSTKNRIITINNDIVIEINPTSKITKYKNNQLSIINKNFLSENHALSEIELLNVKYIDDNFLTNNRLLNKISFPKLEVIRDNFIYHNNSISEVNLPNIKEIGDRFMLKNLFLQKIYLPKIESIGNHFLEENKIIYEIDISNAKYIGNNCLLLNEYLKKIDLSSTISIGNNLLSNNINLDDIKIDNLKEIGNYYFSINNKCKKIVEDKIKGERNYEESKSSKH